MGGDVGPAAFAVDGAIGAHGAEEPVDGGFDPAGFFDDVAERGAEVALARDEEAGGVGVAIEGAPVDIVMALDVVRMNPVQEFLFDFFALVVLADGAAALVALEARWPVATNMNTMATLTPIATPGRSYLDPSKVPPMTRAA